MTLVASHSSNKQTNNNYLDKDKNLRHLDYEDFSHIGLGFETYQDGIQHPLELRKILTGDLSKEMSVSFKLSDEDTFKDLVHPFADDILNNSSECSLEITATTSLAPKFINILPKPPKLFKAGISTPIIVPSSASSLGIAASPSTSQVLSTPSPFIGGLWDTTTPDTAGDQLVNEPRQKNFEEINSIITNRRPGRPPANQGTFDPESGTIRYLCRLECGASLASAKGRRKHEKKHCPNMPKEALMGGGVNAMFPSNPLIGHSLFSGATPRVPMKQRDRFECRICGKVLKTYEGRRLHEKIQHAPGRNKDDRDKKDGESVGSLELEDGEVEGVAIEEEDYADDDDVLDDAEVNRYEIKFNLAKEIGNTSYIAEKSELRLN